RAGASDEQAEDDPGKVTLEGADGLPPGVAGGPLAGDEGACPLVMPRLGEGDDVEGPVELAVAAPVETHPLRLAGARRDRRDAGEHRERGLRAEAADVARLADELG